MPDFQHRDQAVIEGRVLQLTIGWIHRGIHNNILDIVDILNSFTIMMKIRDLAFPSPHQKEGNQSC